MPVDFLESNKLRIFLISDYTVMTIAMTMAMENHPAHLILMGFLDNIQTDTILLMHYQGHVKTDIDRTRKILQSTHLSLHAKSFEGQCYYHC